MAVIRHESLGSFWEIDDVLMRYRRFPKVEDVRRDVDGAPRPDWSDRRAGALEDGVWHSFESWEVDRFGRLLIETGETLDGGAPRWIVAPPTSEAFAAALEAHLAEREAAADLLEASRRDVHRASRRLIVDAETGMPSWEPVIP